MAEKQTIEGKRLSSLIDLIKKVTKLNQEQIAKKVGYEREYLSQAKKTGSDALYFKLETTFKKELENSHILEPDPQPEQEKQSFTKQLHEQKLNNTKKKTVPLFDAPASASDTETDMYPITAPTGTIDIGDLLRDSEAAIRVYGNSMIPNYPPGCMVGLVEVFDKFIEPGEVYVVETNRRRLLKRLFYKDDNPESDTIVLYSDNKMNFEGGPRDGMPAYPIFYINRDEIVRLFAVTGVIKRNSNSEIIKR